MKHIIKGNQPPELRRWIDGQPIVDGQRLNCGYSDMPGDVKRVVKQRLLEEQGWLCCYTGMLITEDRSHIEHFKPRTLCQNHEDVDYANLLAAYPGNNMARCPYGAKAKADWYHVQLLISPLRGDCERRFHFDQFGGIKAANDNDVAAKKTIEHLCLDDASLTELRKQAIHAILYRKSHPLSEAQLRAISRDFCRRNEQRQFPTFCFVIIQAAQALLYKVERERRRRQAIHQQGQR